MDCVVLGTGGMMPMPLRLTTSVLVRREGRMIMFDAGEGIQLALKRGGLGIRSLDAIVVSHLHADHVLGIPGILMFRAQSEDPGLLTIVGPPGLRRFVEHTASDLNYHLNFPFRVVEWRSEGDRVAWIWNGARLYWDQLDHSTLCLGYRLEEPPRPGRFNLDRAVQLGVPRGALFGKLQAGEAVSTPEGRRVSPEEVLGPPRRGRIVAYATDTRPCGGLHRLIEGADIAFVEGMFALQHRADAEEKRHMTAAEAGEAAAAAGVGRLVLVHVSPRYSTEDEKILQSEARQSCVSAEVALPLQVCEVPLPEV